MGEEITMVDTGVTETTTREAVGVMHPPPGLVGRYRDGAATLTHGTAMLCGTLAAG